MALPAPVQQPGQQIQRQERIELGTIGVSLATQHQEWPLQTAASLLEPYRLRQAHQPDLDIVASAKTVECHVTPDLLQQKVYAPFGVDQMTLPAELLRFAATPKLRSGFLPGINTVWMSSESTTLFWDLQTNEVRQFELESSRSDNANGNSSSFKSKEVLDITCGAPNPEIFSDQIVQILVVSTKDEMQLYAVDKARQFVNTDLRIPNTNSGVPKVRISKTGRIFFSCEFTGTALWEFKYSAKESWFRSRVQKVCYGETGGLFGGLFGSSHTQENAEHILNFELDESVGAIYALTTKSSIHVYSYNPDNHGSPVALVKNYMTSQLNSQIRILLHQQQQPQLNGSSTPSPIKKDINTTVVSISPVTLAESKFIRLVALTAGGDRIYFRTADQRRPLQYLTPAFAQSLPLSSKGAGSNFNPASNGNAVRNNGTNVNAANSRSTGHKSDHANEKGQTGEEPVVLSTSAIYSGKTTYAVTKSVQKHANFQSAEARTHYRILAAAVDDTRVAHLFDLRAAPISFVELCGWLELDNDVQFITPTQNVDLVLTRTSLYRIRRRPFSDRFEYADMPFALAQVYGSMQLCEGALIEASQVSNNRLARENAIAAFFRFGGMPTFRRDQLQSGFLGHSSIRLSASFDGLALYLAKLLQPIWGEKILGPNTELKPPKQELLDSIYAELTGLVDLLSRNRTFSEGMSERSATTASNTGTSSSFPIGHSTSSDDAAVLSQAEYKGLFAMGRLAKSSQEGIAFLRLVLTQYNTKLLLSYFDEAKMAQFKQMSFGEFFTQAKTSPVARELVNSLVNYVLSKGESVDAIASIIHDRCSSYCSAGDVLEYKALEYIHSAKHARQPDISSLAKSVALVRKAASTIQLETLRDIIKDYSDLKYYCGAVQAGLAVASEQDPANLAVGFLRSKDIISHSNRTPASKRLRSEPPAAVPYSDETLPSHHAFSTPNAIPVSNVTQEAPISESELKFRSKMAVFNIIFSEVLNNHPWLADSNCKDAAHAAMLNSSDEVWHFALYDWYLDHDKQDQVALLDTPFVATYLELGASRDLRVANLLWKWHQRHGDLLAAADVLLDLARGPLVPTLSQRVEYLSRALGYSQAQNDQHTYQSVNMLTMVRAYLGLALIQADILSELQKRQKAAGETGDDAKLDPLSHKIMTISELYNDWAEPNGLYEVCFSIFEFADLRDSVEIRTCWLNLLTSARAEDDREKVQHYTHVADIIVRLGKKFLSVETIFPVTSLVPMLEQYAVDYTSTAPTGWLVDAFVRAGVSWDTLLEVYTDLLSNQVLEGEYAKHARESLEYIKNAVRDNM